MARKRIARVALCESPKCALCNAPLKLDSTAHASARAPVDVGSSARSAVVARSAYTGPDLVTKLIV